MKFIYQLALLVGLVGLCPALTAQISNISIDSVFLNDTIYYHLSNDSSAKVDLGFIITQDEIVYLSEGDTSITGFGTITLKAKVNQSYNNVFELILEELTENTLADQIEQSEFKVSPNPARDLIQIRIPEIEDGSGVLQLMSATGQLIAVKKLLPGLSIYEMNLNDLSLTPGMYFVILETRKEHLVTKLMVR